MTTNQTIDGVLVPRETLQKWLDDIGPSRHVTQYAALKRDELRALLAAKPETVAGHHPACRAVDDYKPGDCSHSCKPASQPQGEPVAIPAMPVMVDRRPYDDEDPSGYMEGDDDWSSNNPGAVTWLADNHAAIRAGLYAEQPAPFQARVQPWMMACFGEAIAADRQERNHRFLEEALELVQANQCTASEAHQLVDYVYGRPVGEPSQEVGGVMVTLAALCLASGLDMHSSAETELARIWTKVEQIRAKQAAKPAMSPLPGAYPDREQPAPVAITLNQVLAAYDYANSHPHKYLRGTTNWCAAVAHKLNACLDEVTRLNAKSR